VSPNAAQPEGNPAPRGGLRAGRPSPPLTERLLTNRLMIAMTVAIFGHGMAGEGHGDNEYHP